MKRRTILVGTLSQQTGLALCPQGLYVNPKLDKCEKDTLLRFKDAWRATDVLLISKCRLNLNTAIGSFIIRYAFPNKTLADLTAEWDAVAINEGYGSKSYDLSNVLLLNVREYIKEIYEEEQRIKREREEALLAAAEREAEMKARAEERERLLADAKNGIYRHPDIKN